VNRSAYLQTMISLASAAFGVVAALAWNSAITALVKQIFGTGGQIISLFVYAVLITIVAVIVMVNLGHLAEQTGPPKA
jgi:amino acid permease